MNDTLSTQATPLYMNVKQVAAYLHLNEKKVYELVKDQHIPATKVTGKWLFPKGLVDRWLLDSSHGGLLNDRLIISGGDDPLFYRLVLMASENLQGRALINYMPGQTRNALKLMQRKKIDMCCIHWGDANTSSIRHPALLEQYRQQQPWILVHLFKREAGFLVHPEIMPSPIHHERLYHRQYRWVGEVEGTGKHRLLLETLSRQEYNPDDLNITVVSQSDRETAAALLSRKADIGCGTRATATETGLRFIPLHWESFDLAMPKNIWFRHLFQALIKPLQESPIQSIAHTLGGYDLSGTGQLLWGND